MHRLKLTGRKVVLAIVIWVAIALISLGITAMQFYIGNRTELKAVFAPWKVPDKGHTVVVFAPHCDDETLSSGGLIHEALVNGANVWVVVMTNGDGFRTAAMLDNRSIRISPDSYIQFGYRRQKETQNALQKLGLPKDHIITMGYPDQGLEPMWVSNWTTPFRSIYTKDNSSPYLNAYTRNASYTGKQCLADVKKVLVQLKPDDIYMPHPNDEHPDHWATSAYVTTALYELGWLDKKDVAFYIVHRGDWPVPQGLHTDMKLAPPAKLADLDTDWRQFAFDENTEKLKGEASKSFGSQAGMQRFISSFVRQNEIFGIRDPEVKTPESFGIAEDGKTDDWDGIDPIISEPSNDRMPSHSRPGADLTAVYAAKDEKRLHFRISVRGNINYNTIYELRVRPMGEDARSTTSILMRPGNKPQSGWMVAYGKKDIELSCPLKQWDGKPLLILATTRTEWYRITWYRIDRSAYRILLP